MTVLLKVRSALCAASQLPGEGPTNVEDAHASACKSKPDDDDDDDFDLIPLRPLNNLSVMRDGSSWVEPVLS